MTALALALVMTLAAREREGLSGSDTPAKQEPAHPVPPWAPRDASLGVTINAPMVSAQLRIGWQLTFYERRGHDLVLTVVLGTGLALSRPTGMDAHFQHVGLLGIGYRKVGPLLNWGFQWGIGGNWYQADYPMFPTERRLVPYTEGRVQLGVRVLKHLVLGLFVGYGSPVSFDARYPGQTYSGGLMLGFFADWR
jgi:hypothetical protein